MAIYREFGKRLKAGTIDINRAEEFNVIMGRPLDDGTISLQGRVNTNAPLIQSPDYWARLQSDPSQVIKVDCANFTARANAIMVCKKNQAGRVEVIRVAGKESYAVFGDSTGGLTANFTNLDATQAIVGGRNMRPGRLRLAVADTLSITVDSFVYNDDFGDLAYFNAGDSVLDLTSNVPGAGLQRYVLISFDPDPDSPVLVATNGGTVSTGITLTPQVEGAQIDVPEGDIPLALVRLVNGDTSITETRITDWRVWITPDLRETHAGLFTQTEDVTVANTVTETTLLGAGSGSVTIPANMLQVGTTLKIFLRGYVSTVAGSDDPDIRIYWDTVELFDTGFNTPASALTNAYIDAEVMLTCRSVGATGTVVVSGLFHVDQDTYPVVNTSAVTIDTTADADIDITCEWDAADVANTVTAQIVTIERVR